MDMGLLFPFRNPPRWRREFPQFYTEQLQQVKLAEELGYDTVWLSEHHFSEDGYSPSPLTVAAAIATMTSSIRIGTNILILPLGNAIRIAEDAATVDILSNGRLDLGMGRGYTRQEFDGYGISRGQRGSRLREGLDVIEGLWTQDSFSYEGRHYRINNARMMPKPVQQPRPPIWIGTHGAKTLDLAAGRGYHYLGTGDSGVQQVYDEALRRHRRPLSSGYCAHLCWSHVAHSRDQAWENVQEHLHYQFSRYADWLSEAGDLPGEQRPSSMPPAKELRHGFGDELGVLAVGTPDQVAERLLALIRETRTTHLVLGMHLPGLDPDLSRASMSLFAEQVMPLLRQK